MSAHWLSARFKGTQNSYKYHQEYGINSAKPDVAAAVRDQVSH